jgi:hypothetical protein
MHCPTTIRFQLFLFVRIFFGLEKSQKIRIEHLMISYFLIKTSNDKNLGL